ncbi:MAG: SRPBCC domain-containing protein [Proteobacteria bacterium]|nr:SRPBCC domain-containing protein [Pseudomonadota bacterium]
MDTAVQRAEREIVIVREFKASRERVFAAWTDPDQASIWWAPQDCVPLSCTMDVRPGGLWRREMRIPDGSVITKHGVYREVVRPERLVFTYITEYADGRVDPETLVTVTLADRAGGTRLTLRHQAFRTEDSRAGHEGGWTSCLERFATFVTTA